MENTIYTRLSTHTALTDLIGTRLYPALPATNTALPYVVYYVSEETPDITLTSASGLVENTLNLDIVAKDFDEAKAIASVCANRLNVWQELPTIQGCFYTSRSSQEQENYFLLTQSFKVWTQNTI